jgi:cell division protease FtsH
MRVVAGPEKKTRVMGEKERLITAYHEMGTRSSATSSSTPTRSQDLDHLARPGARLHDLDAAGGQVPHHARELQDTMAMTLGGRAAEEIVFGEITTGASNDLEKVTATAKQMVMRFGMSEKLGPRVFGHDHGQPFLGREFSSEPDYSDEIAREIDDEIRRIVEGAHQQAKDILAAHREDLTRISELLLKRETIEREEFEALLTGKSEEEVFGPDLPVEGTPERPELPPAADRAGREVPRPLPRPGLAGGTAEARGLSLPEKPDLA